MAIKTFGKTISGSGLAVDGERLLLQHPQTMAECMGHVVPYQMPHDDGGFLILAEYGTPNCDTGCGDPAPAAKTTCGGGCGCTSKASCTCEKKPDPMAGSLLRFEIVGYSGFDTDGVTALITERGAEGTIKQDWPAGTLVVQAPTGSELGALDDRLAAIEELGCILAVPAAKACEVIKAGQWRCYDGCWRQAKVDVMLSESDDGSLDMPAAGEAGNASWSDCLDINYLLSKASKSQDQLVGPNGQMLQEGACVVTCGSLTGDFAIDPDTGMISINFPSDNVVNSGEVSGTDLLLQTSGGDTITISGLPSSSVDTVISGGSVSGTDLVLNISDGSTVTISGLPSSGIADCAGVLACVASAPAFAGTVDSDTPIFVGDGAGSVGQVSAGDLGLPVTGGGVTGDTNLIATVAIGSCVQLPVGNIMLRYTPVASIDVAYHFFNNGDNDFQVKPSSDGVIFTTGGTGMFCNNRTNASPEPRLYWVG